MLILHLSDIHFKKSEISTQQDPNVHLRNELLRDVVDRCSKLGPPDVVIVGGDVAFAGDPEEFIFATQWLDDLCQACGTNLDRVFVVPGNHDVVRAQAGRRMVQLLHDDIKKSTDPKALIMESLTDPDIARLLYESLDNYNAFAGQFFCDLLPPNRTRAIRDLPLNDGSTLRLWGLNTAFVSSAKDVERSLFVDSASWQISRHEGVTNVVVAHHHLSWLNNGENFGYYLADVAPVQMFGHVHTNRIDRNAEFLRLTASAANPDRREPHWEPGYNLLELEVEGAGNHRKLLMRAHVRIWRDSPGGFVAKSYKGGEVWPHSVDLEGWAPGSPEVVPVVQVDEATMVNAPPLGGSEMSTLRDVGLRFYQLSFSKKSAIAGSLDLLEDEDMQQPDFERFRRVFLRAHKRGLVPQLTAAIDAAERS